MSSASEPFSSFIRLSSRRQQTLRNSIQFPYILQTMNRILIASFLLVALFACYGESALAQQQVKVSIRLISLESRGFRKAKSSRSTPSREPKPSKEPFQPESRSSILMETSKDRSSTPRERRLNRPIMKPRTEFLSSRSSPKPTSDPTPSTQLWVEQVPQMRTPSFQKNVETKTAGGVAAVPGLTLNISLE